MIDHEGTGMFNSGKYNYTDIQSSPSFYENVEIVLQEEYLKAILYGIEASLTEDDLRDYMSVVMNELKSVGNNDRNKKQFYLSSKLIEYIYQYIVNI